MVDIQGKFTALDTEVNKLGKSLEKFQKKTIMLSETESSMSLAYQILINSSKSSEFYQSTRTPQVNDIIHSFVYFYNYSSNHEKCLVTW